jgi:hypothetical protein
MHRVSPSASWGTEGNLARPSQPPHVGCLVAAHRSEVMGRHSVSSRRRAVTGNPPYAIARVQADHTPEVARRVKPSGCRAPCHDGGPCMPSIAGLAGW